MSDEEARCGKANMFCWEWSGHTCIQFL
jgi:hypothetical protein